MKSSIRQNRETGAISKPESSTLVMTSTLQVVSLQKNGSRNRFESSLFTHGKLNHENDRYLNELMIYKQKYFFLCKIPLSAEGPSDVEIVDYAENSAYFPELFKQYEDLRSHAFNEDKIYSIVRADEIYALIRTENNTDAKEMAYEEAESNIITNLQHRVVQKEDKEAEAILREVHDIDPKAEK